MKRETAPDAKEAHDTRDAVYSTDTRGERAQEVTKSLVIGSWAGPQLAPCRVLVIDVHEI